MRYATHQLNMSNLSLGALVFGSLTSAFCFAFLDLDPENLATYADFILQIITYGAQHFFALEDLYNLLPEWPAHKNANAEFRRGQAFILDKLDVALYEANKGFYRNTLPVSDYFKTDGKLDINYLTNWIDQQFMPVQTPPPSVWRNLIYYPAQTLGFLITLVGNFGYHNDTVNGFKKLKFLSLTTNAAWSLATVCMFPVYSLAIIITYRIIDKLFKLFSGEITVDDISFSIKKMFKFSLFTNGTLSAMAIFSFCTAVSLLNDAIYGGNPDNPPQFSGLDTPEQKFRAFYVYATMISLVIFNIFPVPEVADFLAKKMLLWFGAHEDKQKIEVLDFIAAMRTRAAKATPATFEPKTPTESKPININDKTIVSVNGDLKAPLLDQTLPRRNFCQEITQTFCSFFSFSRTQRQSSLPQIHSSSLDFA